MQKLTAINASSCARLHLKCLPEDFLASLGYKFLYSLYKSMLQLDDISAWGIFYKSELTGFVIGISDSSTMTIRILRKNFKELVLWLTFKLIVNPLIIFNLLDTLFYSSRQPHKCESELLFIGVSEKWRRNEVGNRLIEQLFRDFKQKGIKCFSVNVYQKNLRANLFYQKLNGKLIGEFYLYHQHWNSYLFKF